jgi:16S rRNA (guanine(1405)-N(7))-methyltransferase
VFFTSKYQAKKHEYVQELITKNSEQSRQDLLLLHRSSAERLGEYPLLYQQLFSITGIPNSILDLGCGFNPFAYGYLGCKPDYHCADIACEDLELIQTYLDTKNIESSTHCIDLSKPEHIQALPKTELAFAFKLFDSLEEREFNITKQLLEVIPADILIASFPTKSIGGRKTIRERVWFEKLIADKELARVTLSNEQFYVITLSGKEHFTHP